MANLKETITISQKEFRNQFDKVLLDNPTIHKILSKESNLGFTTQLVLDQLKAELTENLFADHEKPQTEETVPDTEEPAKEETPEATEENKNEEPETESTETPDELDELDELD